MKKNFTLLLIAVIVIGGSIFGILSFKNKTVEKDLPGMKERVDQLKNLSEWNVTSRQAISMDGKEERIQFDAMDPPRTKIPKVVGRNGLYLQQSPDPLQYRIHDSAESKGGRRKNDICVHQQ